MDISKEEKGLKLMESLGVDTSKYREDTTKKEVKLSEDEIDEAILEVFDEFFNEFISDDEIKAIEDDDYDELDEEYTSLEEINEIKEVVRNFDTYEGGYYY